MPPECCSLVTFLSTRDKNRLGKPLPQLLFDFHLNYLFVLSSLDTKLIKSVLLSQFFLLFFFSFFFLLLPCIPFTFTNKSMFYAQNIFVPSPPNFCIQDISVMSNSLCELTGWKDWGQLGPPLQLTFLVSTAKEPKEKTVYFLGFIPD